MEQTSFSTAADLTGILGMIFIIFSFSFNSALKTKKSKCLCSLLVTFVGVMLSDLAVTNYRGHPEHLTILEISFALNLLFDNLMIGAFIAYLRMDLRMKKTDWQGETLGISCLLITAALAAISNPLHHRLVSISAETGIETQEPLFLSMGVLCCLVLGVCLYEIIQRKEIRWQNRAALAFFCISHIVTIMTQPLVHGTTLVNLASLFSLLVLYTSFYSEQNLRFSQQELELQNTRAALVLSQIQPHFLFNSMAVVMDLCDTDPKEAKAALQELSDYLHFKITAMSNSYVVDFAEDLEFLQNYLKLEKRRYGSRLRVEYDIQTTDFKLPLLTLQPLVENAIRHGISKRPEGGTVRVTSRHVGNRYSILVEDNGVGFDTSRTYDDSREHVGLASVRTRLNALCDGMLVVRSTPGIGTTVEIIIQKKEDKPHANSGS